MRRPAPRIKAGNSACRVFGKGGEGDSGREDAVMEVEIPAGTPGQGRTSHARRTSSRCAVGRSGSHGGRVSEAGPARTGQAARRAGTPCGNAGSQAGQSGEI